MNLAVKKIAKSKEIEELLSHALENIEERVKLIPELPINEYVDKGKGVILDCKEGTSFNPTNIKQKPKSVDDQILKHSSEYQKDSVNESLNNQHVDNSEDKLQE